MSIKENPYQASRPIKKSHDFFGRKREFQFIYQMLMSNESVNIIGCRRIGKTSFLNVLPNHEIQKNLFGKKLFDLEFRLTPSDAKLNGLVGCRSGDNFLSEQHINGSGHKNEIMR